MKISAAIARQRRINDLINLRDRIDAELTRLQTQAAAEVAAIATESANNPRRPPAECGTPGGYSRHRRVLNEPACDACTAAHTADGRARAARKRAEVGA